MSDLRSPSQPASPVAFHNLDQLVGAALQAVADADARGTHHRHRLGEAYARAAIDAVCQHMRDASLRTALPLDPIDPRVDAAIDDYMSGPAAPLPQAARESFFAVGAAIAELALSRTAEPTADDTITASVLPDGSHADIRHAGGR